MPLDSTQLIDHLDAGLLGKAAPDTDRMIQEDPETAQEWQYLQSAVEAVREAGLYEQVGSVRAVWKAAQNSTTTSEQDTAPPEASSPAVVRSLYKNTLRAAACILVIAGGSAVFKYSTTSSGELYSKNYSSYSLTSNRSAGAQDAIEQAYQNGQWQEVLKAFDAAPQKNNKLYFLAGMADMELHQYDQAVEKFEQVLAANQQSGADYFQDEAEYYLAMSCLARNDVNEAIHLLEKIKANPKHLFHDKAAAISTLDLRIAQYKMSK